MPILVALRIASASDGDGSCRNVSAICPTASIDAPNAPPISILTARAALPEALPAIAAAHQARRTPSSQIIPSCSAGHATGPANQAVVAWCQQRAAIAAGVPGSRASPTQVAAAMIAALAATPAVR